MANKKNSNKTYKEVEKTVKAAKKHPVAFAVVVVVLAAIIAIAAVLWFVKPEVFHKLLGTGEHTFTEWTETKAPTCGAKGEKQRECTVCGDKETEPIPATGKHTYDGDEVCTACGYDNTSITGEEAGAANAELSIHFLELGNKESGDSILIKCGDTEVLIDAGSQQDSSATAIKTYVDKYCTDNTLEYVISTHADTDHIAAFVGSKKGSTRSGILYQYDIGTFIKFDKSDKPLKTEKGNDSLYKTYLDAVEYIENKGTAVYTASQCYDQTDGAKRQYFLDDEQKISLNILYNYYYYNSSSDENNYSVVTLLTEELASGKRHYLFTGDLEEDGESRMVDYYNNPANSKSEYDVLPKVDLYKAGHHGSKTSSTAKLLNKIQPKYVAVCCCCGAPQYTKENDNTFPTQQMIDNVGAYTDKIYVTTLATGLPSKDGSGNYTSRSYGGYASMNGTIVFYSSNGKLKLWCSNNDTILKETAWFAENRVWSGL